MPAQTAPEPSSLFRAINYTEFQEYVANTANAGYSKNLKIPSDLTGIDPAWSTCTPGMYGTWDPPRALVAAPGMVDPTPAQPAMEPSATLAPAAGIASSHLPATPTPAPKESAHETMKSDPPIASADPGSQLKDPQSKGQSDPASSASPADKAIGFSQSDNVGKDPTPISKQGQMDDPANQQYSSLNTSPTHNSPIASKDSPAASDSHSNYQEGPTGSDLTVDPQVSQIGTKPFGGTVETSLTFNPVVLASPSPLTVGGNTIVKAQNGGAVIGKSTYTAGYAGQISSIQISVEANKIVIGTTTHALPTSTAVLIGGKSMIKAANGGVVIGTSTYSPGSEARISDTALSVGVDSVVVGGTSYAIPSTSTQDSLFVDTSPISRASDGGAVFKGNTIALGSQTSINGHAISVGVSTVVVDGTSYALSNSAGAIVQSPHPQPNAPVTLTNGAILTPGGSAATISGTTYAIPSDDSGLIINGQTVPLPTEKTLQSVFSVAGQTFTAAPTGFVIGGQSLTFNGTAATLDGTIVSLGPFGLQIGSKTVPLTSVPTTEGGLGGLIMNGFGSGGEPGATAGAGNGSGVLSFTGDGSRPGINLGFILCGCVATAIGVMALVGY